MTWGDVDFIFIYLFIFESKFVLVNSKAWRLNE